MAGLLERVSSRTASMLTRADPVTIEEFGYMLADGGLGPGGGNVHRTKAGVSIGPERALGIAAWYSGVRALVDSVSFLSTSTYRSKLGGQKDLRANPSWVKKPDAELPWGALLEFWMMSFLHRGNAFAFKIRNDVGQVVGLRPLMPHRVKVGVHNNAKIFEVDGRRDVGYTTREILHIPAMSYDGVVGLDPIRLHAQTLGRVAGADEYASRFLGDGVHMSTYLQAQGTLTKSQARDLAEAAKDLHAGLGNAHVLGVIGNAELKTLALDPEQMQLLETRKYGTIEVSQMLRIPPHKLYELSRSTNNNIEHQSIEWVADGVRPWVERIEMWVNADPDLLPSGNDIEIDMDGLKRGDTATEFEAMAKGVVGGFIMPSEPRRKFNLPHLPGTDVFYRPLNMAIVSGDTGEVISDGTPDAPAQPDPGAPS